MILGINPCNNDSDKFKDGNELYIGTNVSMKCPLTSTQNDEPVDSWPVDLDDDYKATLADILSFNGHFNANPSGVYYWGKFYLKAEEKITLPDALKFTPFLKKTCGNWL